MVSNSGRYVLAFNGEIYNHMDLRYSIRKKNIGYPGEDHLILKLYLLV